MTTTETDDTSTSESNTATITEFQSLQQKSNELFDDLRYLPQIGQKVWQPYFGKAFTLFTKANNNCVLHENIFCLICASSCGNSNRSTGPYWKMLAYCSSGMLETLHPISANCTTITSERKWFCSLLLCSAFAPYSLKTSKVLYLDEAFQFYSAIKSRGYYKTADNKEKMVKKLRYYSRFIVVCLLLDKKSNIQELIQELMEKVKHYHDTYEVQNKKEWDSVITELKAFSANNSAVRIASDDGKPVDLTQRYTKILNDSQRAMANSDLRLKEALVIGSYAGQVKFSDLTVDSFRFLQLMEYDASFSKRSKQVLVNPHKYVLYKPTFNQIAAYLSAGIQELPVEGVMLVYVSSNGYTPTRKPPTDESELHISGGVRTARPGTSDKTRPAHEPHCLYPEDLLFVTRRPLFAIIESDNSTAFKNVSDVFGQPLLILMSPCSYPQVFQEMSSDGNLLTHFLYSPLEAICAICSVTIVPQQTWMKCQDLLDRILDKLAQLCGNCHSLDFRVRQFMGDDFLLPLITKFLFCCSTLHLHQLFKEPGHYPSSFPEFPSKELIHNPSILSSILSLTSLLEVRSLFYELKDL